MSGVISQFTSIVEQIMLAGGVFIGVFGAVLAVMGFVSFGQGVGDQNPAAKDAAGGKIVGGIIVVVAGVLFATVLKDLVLSALGAI